MRSAYLLRPISEDVVYMEHRQLGALTRDECWSWLAWHLLTTKLVGGGVAHQVEITCSNGCHRRVEEHEELRIGKTSDAVEGIMWVYRAGEASA